MSPQSIPPAGRPPGAAAGGPPPGHRPRISILGGGRQSAEQAALLLDLGFEVVVPEPDPRRLSAPDAAEQDRSATALAERLRAALRAGRLTAVENTAQAVERCDIHLVCVSEDRTAPTAAVEATVREIGPHLRPGALVVGCGHAPVGTAARMRDLLLVVASTLRFDVAWLPPSGEGLVFEVESPRAESLLRGVFHPLIARGARVHVDQLFEPTGAETDSPPPRPPGPAGPAPAVPGAPPVPPPAAKRAGAPDTEPARTTKLKLRKTTKPAKSRTLPSIDRDFRPDIEGLRAVAVLLVVLYHAELLGMGGGFVGVDVFFVISGFLITRQLFRTQQERGRVRLVEFYVRRMKRLLPAAAIVTLAVLAAARFWSGPMAARDVARDAFFSAVYGMNFHLAAEGTDYLNADEPPSPLQHYWSLSVEEQFYIAFPFLVLAVAIVALRFQRAVLTGVLLLIVAGSLYLSVTMTPRSGVDAYFSTGTRAWEFALGGLVAMLAPWLVRTPRVLAALMSWAGLGLIIYAGLTYGGRTEFPGSAALIPVGGAALLIAAGGRLVPGGAESLLGRRPAQAVGRLSYSLYLWHWPALFYLPLALDRGLVDLTDLSPQLRLSAIGIALVLAVLTYAAVEAPLRRVTLRRPVWMIPGLGLSAATAATALVFAATLPALNGGGAPAQAVTLSPATTGDSTVAAALQAGVGTRQVPRNLRPSLGNAEQDHDYATGCHLNFDTVAHPRCAFGAVDDPAARTMVLFGDSHAAHWFAPLQALADARGWKLLWRTKSACAPAEVPAYNEQLRRDYRECTQWRKDRVEEIATVKPDLVVVGQADIVPGVDVSDAQFAAGTARTLTELRESGALVVLMGDVPQAPADPVECLAENLKDARKCAYPRAGAYRAFPDRQAAIASALRQRGLEMIPTTNWVCTPRWCPPVVADMLTYRDADHLSRVYARWLAPMLEPIMLFAEARSPGSASAAAAKPGDSPAADAPASGPSAPPTTPATPPVTAPRAGSALPATPGAAQAQPGAPMAPGWGRPDAAEPPAG